MSILYFIIPWPGPKMQSVCCRAPGPDQWITGLVPYDKPERQGRGAIIRIAERNEAELFVVGLTRTPRNDKRRLPYEPLSFDVAMGLRDYGLQKWNIYGKNYN
jgi:hypothetical protein